MVFSVSFKWVLTPNHLLILHIISKDVKDKMNQLL